MNISAIRATLNDDPAVQEAISAGGSVHWRVSWTRLGWPSKLSISCLALAETPILYTFPFGRHYGFRFGDKLATIYFPDYS